MSLARFRLGLGLLGLISCSATSVRADIFSYDGNHETKLNSAHYEAVHSHDWNAGGDAKLFAQPAELDRLFTTANTFSRLAVRERTTGKTVFETPTPALTYLWISPDESLLVGLSNIKLSNSVQLAVWCLPSGKLIWREHIAPEVAELSASQMADQLLAYPENASALAPLTRRQGSRYYVDFLQMNMPTRIGHAAWKELFQYRATHPYSVNFSETVTNHVYWYREPDPALRLEPGKEAGTFQLSLLDPCGIRFRISLPADDASAPQPSSATPYPWQHIGLTDPSTLHPDATYLSSIAKRNSPAFVVLPPAAIDTSPSSHLQQTLSDRLRVTEHYTLFTPTETELAAARTHTLYLYFVVPGLREKNESTNNELGQLLGVELGGRRCVLVNVIPKIASRHDTEFWLWHDGGARIFQLLYDIEAGSIVRWQFNGSF